jgi:hypothetical protein
VLCPEHFNRLQPGTQTLLVASHHDRRKHLVIGLGGFFALFGLGIILIPIFQSVGAPDNIASSIWLIPLLLSITLMILETRKEDDRINAPYIVLKEAGVKLLFTGKDTGTYVCEVCGQLGPPKSYGRARAPYKCAACEKVLCINCYSDGLCPEHAAIATENDRKALEQLARREQRPLLMMIPLSTMLFTMFALGIVLEATWLIILDIILFLVLAVAAVCWESLGGGKYRYTMKESKYNSHL